MGARFRDRVAGFRVAQLLPGIGASSAARLLDRIAESPNAIDALSGFRPPAATAEHWQQFEATIGMLAATRRAGRANLISSAVGMGRISNAFTRTQHFAQTDLLHSQRLLRPIRAASAF